MREIKLEVADAVDALLGAPALPRSTGVAVENRAATGTALHGR